MMAIPPLATRLSVRLAGSPPTLAAGFTVSAFNGGVDYGTAYAASKFGVDGWMESLRVLGEHERRGDAPPLGVCSPQAARSASASTCAGRRRTSSSPSAALRAPNSSARSAPM
jgi:NAD(P)-dependent dehydrogenase (short-subunit alcohol dehydrogenase family)